MIANSNFTQPVTVRVDTETELGSQAEDEAVRYDLSIRPLVVALREGVTRIAAEMVLVVVGGALGQGREIAGRALNMIWKCPPWLRRSGHRPDVCALTITLLRPLV